ncbi:MAG: hypothetical protein BBJ57_11920 [Desulfobacterales bacterium PC51MH44]|nr:MAG: hypothetical protein BBJ57_11920 [Desulfobacterales bacterium PC51MH44]
MIFDELALLINALKNKGTGFYLVEAPDDATHDDLIDKIKNALESHEDKKTAVIYLLEKPPAQSIFSFVRDFVESFYDRQIFFIRNLEIAAGNIPENFLRELNFSRETLDSLDRNFIFMMTPDFAGLFMKYAKDIFSWIPHRYRFEGKDIGFQKPVRPIYAEEKDEIGDDKDRKYVRELIDLYEEQLKETLDDPKFSVKNIIKPLADLYKEYGDYDKELSRRQQIAAFYKEMGGAEYAESLVKLGVQYNLSAGGQAGNAHPEESMQKAIEAFKEALKIYTLEKFPVEYARTMNNLGVAYWESPADNIIDKNENLQNAISAYKDALKIYNAKDFSVEYAETQYNLELAYRELPDDFNLN